MTIRIVRARSRHAEAIAALIRETGIGDIRPASVRPSRFWVATDHGTVVGCASIDWHGRDVAVLSSCAVKKPYRHRGIGTAFVNLRLAEARKRRKRTAALCTMYYSFRHYKKLGFRTVPRAQLPDTVRDYEQFTVKRYMKCAVMTMAL